jgi:hypothetical protein
VDSDELPIWPRPGDLVVGVPAATLRADLGRRRSRGAPRKDQRNQHWLEVYEGEEFQSDFASEAEKLIWVACSLWEREPAEWPRNRWPEDPQEDGLLHRDLRKGAADRLRKALQNARKKTT